MNKNHEIERLTFELVSLLDRENIDKFIEDGDGNLVRVETYSLYEVAKSLVNKGYGDINQALTEFADKILFWLYDREKIVTRFVDEEAKITLGRLSELERCREKINEILMEFIPNGDISE